MIEKMISVIVPVYNAENTLARCVSSLIGQTYENIEIILVNDGSKDGSLQICRCYEAEDSRIRVIDKPNGGVSSARNAGLDIATGEFIMFCDSDDWVEPNWCETMLSHYSPGNLVMCGYYCHFQDKSHRVVSCSLPQEPWEKDAFFLLQHLGAFVPWNKLYEYTVIQKASLRFSTRLTLGEDELFVWRYLQAISGHLLLINQPLNHYVWPEAASLTRNLPTNYHEQCRYLFQEIFGDIHSGAACSPLSEQAFINSIYWQFERGIKRLFQNSAIPFHSRITQATAIMQAPEYRYVATHLQSTQNAFVRLLCRGYSSVPLYLLYRLGKY